MKQIKEDKMRLKIAALTMLLGPLLFVGKLYAYQVTQSQAVLSDALESIINILGSIVTFFVIKVAVSPADKDHPYGHGKAEYFAASFEGGAITFAGIMICFVSIKNLWDGVFILKNLDIGLAIVLAAGLINGGLGMYLQKMGAKLDSKALYSSGKHLFSDFLTSVGIIVGLLLVKWTNILWLDPIIAILIGLQLIYHGFQILKDSTNVLMDGHNPEILNKLLQIFNQQAFEGIIRIHHVKVMRSGRYHHIDLHVVVPEFWSIEMGHDKSGEFSRRVFKDYGKEGEMHFHLDPCLQKYCKACSLSDCSVRKEQFQAVIPFSMEEFISPEEIYNTSYSSLS